jgi:HlyD family secretion protein
MKPWWRNRKLLIGIALFGVLVALAFWPESATVETARVQRGELVVTVDEDGETRVRNRFVVSAPVAGRLQRVELEPGDPLVRGRTVVAAFVPADPAPLDVRSRAEAEAAVKAAEAAQGRVRAERDRAAAVAELARSELARVRALVQKQVAPRQQLEAAESQARATQDAVRAAEFAMNNAAHELAMARARLLSAANPSTRNPIVVRSPIDGVVLKRLRESEAVVPAGEPLLELGDPSQLEIVADFLSTDAVKIRPGAPVSIERWGGDAPLHGCVQRVEPSGFMKLSALGVEEQRVNVVIAFDDPHEAWKRLGDGYRVEVRVIVWQGRDVLKVPTSSLFRRGESWAVFTAEAGRARLRAVEIGQRNGAEAHVLKGLDEGQFVIVHPSDAVTDGARVRLGK